MRSRGLDTAISEADMRTLRRAIWYAYRGGPGDGDPAAIAAKTLLEGRGVAIVPSSRFTSGALEDTIRRTKVAGRWPK